MSQYCNLLLTLSWHCSLLLTWHCGLLLTWSWHHNLLLTAACICSATYCWQRHDSCDWVLTLVTVFLFFLISFWHISLPLMGSWHCTLLLTMSLCCITTDNAMMLHLSVTVQCYDSAAYHWSVMALQLAIFCYGTTLCFIHRAANTGLSHCCFCIFKPAPSAQNSL